MILAQSQDAQKALDLVESLQERFVSKLNQISKELGEDIPFEEVRWMRDEGNHGGGSRFEAKDLILFNRASVNVSQVHYDDMPDKKLQSATAISTIIHPNNPNAPSIHIHISYTELRDTTGYWRIMADLNPSVVHEEDKEFFDKVLKELAGERFEEGKEQGDKYFYIPALERHRGVSHFYLENYFTEDKTQDFTFAQHFGEGIIDAYIDLTIYALQKRQGFSVLDIKEQLDYHTVYLFQVLTLDRGTTSGLLIHDQNDVGIMGSLPSYVNKNLLETFADKVEAPQDELVRNIVDALAYNGEVDTEVKARLAEIVREHYKKYPDALKLQASGNTIPNTVGNHHQ